MPEHYSIKVTKDYLVFSAAHFITYNGSVCERLHGHNYKVSVDVHGALDQNYYVVDFIALRDELQSIVARLDHHMLLPTTHPAISVREIDDGNFSPSVEAVFENRRWVFPREDCVLLPMANTTTELLARYIGEELRERLQAFGANPEGLTVGVDENEGQWGRWHWRS